VEDIEPVGATQGGGFSLGAVGRFLPEFRFNNQASDHFWSVGADLGLTGFNDNGNSAFLVIEYGAFVAYRLSQAWDFRLFAGAQSWTEGNGTAFFTGPEVIYHFPKGVEQQQIIPQYSVTVSGDSHQSISPSSVQIISSGSTLALTVTAASGYLNSTIVTGTCTSGSWSGNVYRTGAVTSACTVVFSSVVGDVVTASGGTGQLIAPSAAQTVASGSTLSFTVTPASGQSNSQNVGGSCAAGTWVGATYTTGVITSSCTVSFTQLTGYTLNFIPTTAELDWSNIYNFIGIATDGTPFSVAQGFDHDGNSYSSTCLTTPTLTYSSVNFSIGAANSNDVFNNSSGVVLNVPTGIYTTLWVLAAGVNGHQLNQPFVFTYATGSPITIDQSLSDWGTGPGNTGSTNYANEFNAETCSYRDTYTGGQDVNTFWVFAYSFALDTTRDLQSIQTPANVNVQIIGMTLD
jgi:hypothetical protein